MKWTPSSRTALLALVAAALSWTTADAAVAAAFPRRPPPLVPHDGKRRAADSDGITRTAGANCRSSDGVTCDLCCNGICCEDFSSTPAAPIPTSHRIGLRFAVISHTNSTFASLMSPSNDGLFSTRIQQNIATLNRIFGPILNVWFFLESATWWSDSRMVASLSTDPCYTSLSCDFYSYTLPAVRGDSSKLINVIVADEIGYLGESQWPWASVENSQYQYIEVHAKTIGVSGPGWPTGLGYTFVHEMGHYFGLLHVFERPGHCDLVNDWVDDTPATQYAASREQDCNKPVDSCPSLPGNDAVNNFMNYARDECMTGGFTPGQINRLRQGAVRYRPLLMASTVDSAGLCPPNTTTIAECEGTTRAPSTTVKATTKGGNTATPTETLFPPTSTVAANGTAPPQGDGGDSDTVIGAVIGAAIIVIVAICVCLCARARQRKRSAGYAPAASPTPTKEVASKRAARFDAPHVAPSAPTIVSDESEMDLTVSHLHRGGRDAACDSLPLTKGSPRPAAFMNGSSTKAAPFPLATLLPRATNSPTSAARIGPLAQSEWSDDEHVAVDAVAVLIDGDEAQPVSRRADGEVVTATAQGGASPPDRSPPSLNDTSLHTAISAMQQPRQHSRVASATSDALRTPRSCVDDNDDLSSSQHRLPLAIGSANGSFVSSRLE